MKLLDTLSNPRQASILLIALLFFSVAASAGVVILGRPVLINAVYLGSTVSIAVILYACQPKLYFGWTWLLWFFSPFIRRVFDYLIGEYNPAPLPLLAPSLASCLCLLAMLQHADRLVRSPFNGLLLLFLGSTYGFLIALPSVPFIAATQGYLSYIAPLALCFNVILFWKIYPQHRDVFQTVLGASVVILGTYGVYQYFYLPPWDEMWMIGAGMDSIGFPRPQEFRVFSTLNSPGPFGMVMAASLLYLFSRSSIATTLLSIPGYFGWLLAMVRASWVGWVVGIAAALLNTRGRERARLVYVLFATAVLGIPVFLATDAIETTVVARMETLQNVEDDGSFQGRLGQYQSAASAVMKSPFGGGTGSSSVDSGVVTVFLQLGVFGGLVYYFGFFLVLRAALRARSQHTDTFARYALSVGLMMTFLMLAGGQNAGLNGCFLWVSLGLSIAGSLYANDRSERILVSPSPA